MKPARSMNPDPHKVGVILPTCNRPDMLRHCVLQLLAQSRPPDLICVHENGLPASYRWCIEDLGAPVLWLHTPHQVPQHEFYLPPLLRAIDAGCTHFFWIDHDDIYLANHIEVSLAELDCGYDLRLSAHCGLLVIRPQFRERAYEFHDGVRFDMHAPGGMSASMAFNRTFAIVLAEHLPLHPELAYCDQVVAHVLMPLFRCYRSAARTTVYVSHPGSASSRHWVDMHGIRLPPFTGGGAPATPHDTPWSPS
jgi:hypothetical protein